MQLTWKRMPMEEAKALNFRNNKIKKNNYGKN